MSEFVLLWPETVSFFPLQKNERPNTFFLSLTDSVIIEPNIVTSVFPLTGKIFFYLVWFCFADKSFKGQVFEGVPLKSCHGKPCTRITSF
jgi:hypothetical protein